MNNSPLVSIVVPNYNGEVFLGECINSVINQTYENWELIICDDASTDSSIKLISSYTDNRILDPIILQENSGAAVVRNKAINAASGKFIAFLDNDDYWLPTKLEEQINFMLSNDYSFTYTDYIQFSSESEKAIDCRKKVSKNDLLKNNYILTSTVIYNSKLLGKIYMAEIRKRQDWSLFINIIQKSQYAYNYPKKLTYYRKHEDSLSAKKLNLLKYTFDFYNKVLSYGKIASFFMLIQYLFYYFFKKFKERFF